jgi:23S rRNA pseudouridine1911/1915/1917 synthase
MSRAASKRLSRRVAAGEDGQRLDRLLETWLPEVLGGVPVSRGAVRRLVMAGAVQVGGRPQRRPGAPLRAGTRVDALLDAARLGPPPRERAAALGFGPERFLHRDAFVLAVDKPAGLAMHATADASRPNLYDLVKTQLRTEGKEPYLGLHQRLDRDTSGVVLFTLDPAANAPLAAAFASGGIDKTYHALCARPASPPPSAWREAGPLGGDGPLADATFRILRTLPSALLVEARPSTGRKHQIRIQLAGRGLPILGDERYGAPRRTGVSRVMLHARRLGFTHPITGAETVVTSAYPADFREALVTRRGGRARS